MDKRKNNGGVREGAGRPKKAALHIMKRNTET